MLRSNKDPEQTETRERPADASLPKFTTEHLEGAEGQGGREEAGDHTADSVTSGDSSEPSRCVHFASRGKAGCSGRKKLTLDENVLTRPGGAKASSFPPPAVSRAALETTARVAWESLRKPHKTAGKERGGRGRGAGGRRGRGRARRAAALPRGPGGACPATRAARTGPLPSGPQAVTLRPRRSSRETSPPGGPNPAAPAGAPHGTLLHAKSRRHRPWRRGRGHLRGSRLLSPQWLSLTVISQTQDLKSVPSSLIRGRLENASRAQAKLDPEKVPGCPPFW